MKTNSILLSLLTLLVSAGANASVKINGVYYDVAGTTAVVTYQHWSSVESPSEIPNGYDYEENDIGGDEEYHWVYDYYYSDMSGAVTIPSTVTYNGKTYQVTAIKNHAFDNCSVTSVTIQSDNLLADNCIGEKSFKNYKGALVINCELPELKKDIGDDDYYWVNYFPFQYCKFTSLTFGEKVTSIRNSEFSNCSSLSTLTISSSITSIGDYAFSNCSNLAVVDINATSLTSIGSGAFSNCSKLKTVNLNSIASWLNCSLSEAYSSPFCYGADLYVADEEKTTISFPVTTTKIPAYAFYGCCNITSVTIPARVSSIGTEAFGKCPSLTTINVNSNNSNYSIEDGILYNANKTTLVLCPAAKTGVISIPQTVTSIASSAFYGCSGITSLTLPSSLTSIGYSTFSGCTGITSLTLPSSLTSIGNYAFSHCSGITSVTLPNTLAASVGTNAFYGCSGITAVNIMISDISSISSDRAGMNFLPASAAWYYYLNDNLLTTLDVPSSITRIGNNAFYNAKGIPTSSMRHPNVKVSPVPPQRGGVWSCGHQLGTWSLCRNSYC